MIDLKKLAGFKYRLRWDESASIPGQTAEDRAWLRQIPCQRGHIFIQAEDELGVWCNKGPTIAKLRVMPGLKLLCRGDREASFAFHPDMLDVVCELMGVLKKKQLSPEQKARLIALGAKHRFLPRGRESKNDPRTGSQDQGG